jgi:anti-anti-sigma factor
VVAALAIETRDERNATVVELAGEFDLAGVQHFEAVLKKLEADGPAILAVDLNRVEFMDSSGLRALVMADQRAKQAGRRLAIVPGPPVVRRVFEITQLEERLDLVDDPSRL